MLWAPIWKLKLNYFFTTAFSAAAQEHPTCHQLMAQKQALKEYTEQQILTK